MAISNTNVNILNGSAFRHLDKDVAVEIVLECARPVDRAIERQVVRNIDLTLMPFMWIGYGLVFYDKVQDERLQL